MASNSEITPQLFVEHLFPAGLLHSREGVLVSVTRDKGMANAFFHPRSAYMSGHSSYFCVSTVARARNEYPRRRLIDLRSAWVIVCDDVGTKAKPAPIKPSYVIETSEGNFQHGYLLQPFDVSDPEGAGYYDACTLALADAGYNDPGCRSASRIVRLPGSVHKTGFIARVADWHQDRFWDLPDLMGELSLVPHPGVIAKAKKRFEPNAIALSEVADPMLDWLSANQYTWGTHNEHWVHIRCPWELEHTSDSGPTSTAYSPLDYGYFGRSFKCFHGHCQGRTVRDLASWIESQGGPGLAAAGA